MIYRENETTNNEELGLTLEFASLGLRIGIANISTKGHFNEDSSMLKSNCLICVILSPVIFRLTRTHSMALFRLHVLSFEIHKNARNV